MHAGEILSLIGLNCVILAGFLYLQSRVMNRQLRNLKSEILELEDLVAAILEEFEEVAASLETTPSPSRPEQIGPANDGAKGFTDDLSLPETLSEKHPEMMGQFSGVTGEPKETPAVLRSQTADLRHVKILELWNHGIPVEEIARQLGTGRGEVQLVLGIYHKI